MGVLFPALALALVATTLLPTAAADVRVMVYCDTGSGAQINECPGVNEGDRADSCSDMGGFGPCYYAYQSCTGPSWECFISWGVGAGVWVGAPTVPCTKGDPRYCISASWQEAGDCVGGGRVHIWGALLNPVFPDGINVCVPPVPMMM